MKKNMVISINPDTFIPVDEWDTDEKPANGDDKIFRSSRNQLILPLSEFFNTNKDKQLDYLSQRQNEVIIQMMLEIIYVNT